MKDETAKRDHSYERRSKKHEGRKRLKREGGGRKDTEAREEVHSPQSMVHSKYTEDEAILFHRDCFAKDARNDNHEKANRIKYPQRS